MTREKVVAHKEIGVRDGNALARCLSTQELSYERDRMTKEQKYEDRAPPKFNMPNTVFDPANAVAYRRTQHTTTGRALAEVARAYRRGDVTYDPVSRRGKMAPGIIQREARPRPRLPLYYSRGHLPSTRDGVVGHVASSVRSRHFRQRSSSRRVLRPSVRDGVRRVENCIWHVKFGRRAVLVFLFLRHAVALVGQLLRREAAREGIAVPYTYFLVGYDLFARHPAQRWRRGACNHWW